MIWNLDVESETPIYLQLRNQVVLSIASGALKPGDQLPTIRALSDESGINMMTVSKAYQLLKSEGYVYTERRSGTVVADRQAEAAPGEERMDRLRLALAELKTQGLGEDEILDLCRKCLKEGK